jgi:AraC-like ligand binding domain
VCSYCLGTRAFDGGWSIRSRHMHDFYAVSLNYRGRGAYDCRREVHEATPGTCNLIAPGELHTGRATCGHGWIYRNLHIEPALMVRLVHSIEWRGPSDVSFQASLVKDAVLAARLARVFASMGESGSLLEDESLLLSVVARLITDHFVHGHALGVAGREHAAVTRVKEWLDANAEQNVSIRSLAELAGLSPYAGRDAWRLCGVPCRTTTPRRFYRIFAATSRMTSNKKSTSHRRSR